MFTQSRSLAGQIKGLRYAVHLNDFMLAQRFRMALVATLRHLDEPMCDEVARFGGCERELVAERESDES